MIELIIHSLDPLGADNLQENGNGAWDTLERIRNFPFALENFLTGAMALVFRLGWIIGAICLLVGMILYLSGWDEYKGKRLIFGGFFLFFVFLYLDLGYVVDIFGGFGNATQAGNQTQTISPPPSP